MTTDKKHKRLEELKSLLNFCDDGYWLQYSYGYKQAEIDLKDNVKGLVEALEHLKKCPEENNIIVAEINGGEFITLSRYCELILSAFRKATE